MGRFTVLRFASTRSSARASASLAAAGSTLTRSAAERIEAGTASRMRASTGRSSAPYAMPIASSIARWASAVVPM